MYRTLIFLCLLPGMAQAGERVRFLCCPPHLSYCYWDYKPLELHIRDEDAEVQRHLRRLPSERERDSRVSTLKNVSEEIYMQVGQTQPR
jgi:hypothetical protein